MQCYLRPLLLLQRDGWPFAHKMQFCWTTMEQGSRFPSPPWYNSFRNADGPIQWVQQLLQQGAKTEQRRRLGILFTTWWHVWKERNRRVFDRDEKSVQGVFELIKSDIISLNLAILSEHYPLWSSAAAADPPFQSSVTVIYFTSFL